MTNDGQFRVIAVTMKEACHEAASRQSVASSFLARQAELMCAAVLVRETMQPGNRVQISLKDAKGHRLIADSLPDGKNRSIVNPGDSSSDVTGSKTAAVDGLLQVNYTLRNGDLHQGIVPLEQGIEVSDAIMHYLLQSEQITAFVAIEALMNNEKLAAAGGFVVQMTPETTKEGLVEMTEALACFDGLSSWLAQEAPDPADLIASILQEREYALLADSPLCFGCTCSEERMLLGLSTLPTADIGELIESGDIEVSCDACGACYCITTDKLAEAFISGGKPGIPN